MANGTRTAPALAMAVAALVGTFPARTATESHVRASSARIATAIGQATERSATFRRLLATIDASDSYVYVNEGDCGHGVRACFVSVTSSESSRYMFVPIDSRKADSELMGLIGHELRHTIEVIGEPSVRDNCAKYLFYERTATHGLTGTHETHAAVNAGNTVRSEVEKFNHQASAISTQGTSSARQ